MRHFLLKYLHITQILTCLRLVSRVGILQEGQPGQAAAASLVIKGVRVAIPDRDASSAAEVGAAQVVWKIDIFKKFDSDYKVTGHIIAHIAFKREKKQKK